MGGETGDLPECRPVPEPPEGLFWLLSAFSALLTAGPGRAAEKSIGMRIRPTSSRGWARVGSAVELALAVSLAVALTGFSIVASRSSLWDPPARPTTAADPGNQARPRAITLPLATNADVTDDDERGNRRPQRARNEPAGDERPAPAGPPISIAAAPPPAAPPPPPDRSRPGTKPRPDKPDHDEGSVPAETVPADEQPSDGGEEHDGDESAADESDDDESEEWSDDDDESDEDSSHDESDDDDGNNGRGDPHEEGEHGDPHDEGEHGDPHDDGKDKGHDEANDEASTREDGEERAPNNDEATESDAAPEQSAAGEAV